MVVLDVSLGLVFFYLLFSLIGSAVAESFELLLKARARTLEEGIRSLLFDPKGEGFALRFYMHPLIRSLRREPTDIPLPFKVLRRLGTLWEKLKNKGKSPGDSSVVISRYELPSYIPADLFVTALLDTIGRPAGAEGTTEPVQGLTLKKLQAAIASLGQGATANKDLRDALMALLPAGAMANVDDASRITTELTAFQTKVEAWFNGSMDRVSGWYKQRTQWVLFLIGLVTSVILNADSIRIAQALARDRALRESVATMAEQFMKDHPPPAPATPAGTAGAPDAGVAPPAQPGGTPEAPDAGGTPAAPRASEADAAKAYSEQLQRQLDEVSERINDVKGLGLPLGWSAEEMRTLTGEQTRNRGLLILLKLLGLLATAVAVSIGSPFWFDLLNKFMVVRSTVKPQEKSREESSKDR